MNLSSPIARVALLFVAVSTAVVVCPVDVQARPSRRQLREAETYVKLAKEHFQAKRYEQAADLFMRVYRLSKKVTAVFNAARCKEMAGRLGDARSLFELYLSISDDEAGKGDARDHLVDIAKREQAQRDAAKAEQQRKLEQAQSAKQAREEAELAAKQAHLARDEAEKRTRELEKQSAADKLKAAAALAAARKAQEAAKARQAPVAPKALAGVVILPPVGVHGGELAIAAAGALKAATAEAEAARIGKVRAVSDYNMAESRRGVVGTCDLPCRLGVARTIGARWALGTTASQNAGKLQLHAVLWRTIDMAQDGVIKVEGTTPVALRAAYEATIGDLFNRVRILPLLPFRPVRPVVVAPGAVAPAVIQVRSQPDRAHLFIDGKSVGQTPKELRLAQGWHRIQMRTPGHRSRGGLAYARSNTHSRVTVVLPEVARAVAIVSPQPTLRGTPVARSAQSATTPSDAKPRKSGVVQAHPPAAGSGSGRDFQRPGDRPATGRRGLSNDYRDQRHNNTGPRATTVVSSPGVGWLWGAVLHLTGAIGTFDPRTAADEGGADVSLGGGGFLHLGYASDGAPHVPWFSLVGGVKFNAWQGFYSDSTGAAGQNGPELFGGLIFPRLWGLMLTYHRAWVGNDLTADLHSYDSLGFGIARTSDFLFWRFGFESRRSSARSVGLDAFGEGPTGRVLLELGFKLGGAQFSK